MQDTEVKIKINEKIEAIMRENLSERVEDNILNLTSCDKCRYYEHPWVCGGELHCCAHDFENTRSSREKEDLYNNCPINHQLHTTKTSIKKYGIIHNKSRGYSRGSISVVDFSNTTFEWDGNNPDVEEEPVVIFFYSNQEEADVMMDLALEYYNRFNLDAEYVKKHCFG